MNIPGKLITFIIQAILVIAAVFAFSYIDPLNIFNTKKLTMKDTPVIVNSIKGIGKLITAEYYGEVIKSSQDTFHIIVENEKKDWTQRLMDMEQDVKEALAEMKHKNDSLKAKIRNRRHLYREFQKQYPEITDNPDFSSFIEILEQNTNKAWKSLLLEYYDTRQVKLQKEKNVAVTYAQLVEKYVNKAYLLSNKEQREIVKNSVALLGRGWVKAGIDLSNFDEDHFKYYPEKNLVRLLRHAPEVISETINPWFIPQKKIKGFEYLFVGDKLEKNPEGIKTVEKILALKKACLESLHQDALDAGLLVKAKLQAEISLTNFLSLVLGKEIKVEIFSHPLDALQSDLLKQGKLSHRNIQSVDSAARQYVNEDPERVFDFLKTLNDSLKANQFLKTNWKVQSAHWGIAALFFKVAEDSFLTVAEKDSVALFLKAHQLEARNKKMRITDHLYASLSNQTLADSLKALKFHATQITLVGRSSVSLVVNSNLDSLKKWTEGLRVEKIER